MACFLNRSAPVAAAAPETGAAAGRLCALACSPRAGGNSDTAAALVCDAAGDAGLAVDRLFLRDFAVRPCVSCGHCLKEPGVCPLDAGDDAGRLFARLHEAEMVVIAAPVYFYGPPAGLKALIDRAQRFWAAGPALPPRPAASVLCAGRANGERLFEASLLILRCFARVLGRELAAPLLIRDVDAREALAANAALVEKTKAWSRDLFRRDGRVSARPDPPAGGSC